MDRPGFSPLPVSNIVHDISAQLWVRISQCQAAPENRISKNDVLYIKQYRRRSLGINVWGYFIVNQTNEIHG